MLYLALGFAALALFMLVGRGKPLFGRVQWRFLSWALSVAAFTGAAFVGVRGGWGSSIVLTVLGLWLAVSTRRAPAAGAPAAPASRMSLAEARRILGVEEGASRQEIQAAYTRLMRLAHPDKGGTAGLAAQLNAARDRLLK